MILRARAFAVPIVCGVLPGPLASAAAAERYELGPLE
jgi:hypothetical protein